MLPDCIKKLIEDQVRTAWRSGKETVLSFGLKHFLFKEKTDADYFDVLKEIKEVIATNPIFAKQYLGEAYSFFENFGIVKINIKHTDVDAMIKEVLSKTEGVVHEKNIDAIVEESLNKLAEKAFGAMMSGAPVNKEKMYIKKEHTNLTAEQLYRLLHSGFNNVFSQLIPNPDFQIRKKDLDDSIENLYSIAKQLRDLACTKPAA